MKIDASEYVLPVNKPLNEAEMQVINVLVDRDAGIDPGAFRKAMIEAIAVADEAHRFWAHEQMPELVDAVLAYQLGNLYQRWQYQYGEALDTPNGGE